MPPRKPKAEDAPVDPEELLAETPVEEAVVPVETPADPETPAEDFDDLLANEPVETPQQRRIRELQAALEEPDPEPEDESEETEEDRQIKELEHQLAQKKARALSAEKVTYAASAGDGEEIVFHIVKDGFTAFSNVWLRGQNLSVRVGSPEWQRTLDINGKSFLDVLDDIQGQYSLWGDRMIAPGRFIPRPDEVFEDDIAREDARRGTSIPTFR